MKKLAVIILLIVAGCASIQPMTEDEAMKMAEGAGAGLNSYTLNTTPLPTDAMLGIDDPDGSWAANRFRIYYIVGFDGSLVADDTYTGQVVYGLNAGESITQWDTVYYDDTDREYKQADADATGEWPARGIAVAAGTDGNELLIMTQGIVRNDAWNWTTDGAPLYLSDTAGGITETAPSSSGDCVQLIGWTISDDEVYFNFSGEYMELE